VFALLDQLLAISGAIILLVWAKRIVARSPGRSSLYPPFHAFREDAVLLAMLGYLVAAMFLSGLMKSTGRSSDQVLTGLVVNNGAQLCGVAVCVALAARRVPGGIRSFVCGEPGAGSECRRTEWSETMCLIVVAVGVCPLIRDVTARLIVWIMPDFPFESHPTLQALEEGGLSGIRVVALWIGAAMIAPLAEEMFFRGILQNFLSGATKKTGLAVALSATAFAAVHFSQPHAVPALFFLGVLLSAAYVRTGRLYVPIVIHAAFNLKTLVWETLERQWG
jgi:membrane protease YdiL (CAAX protease family)